MEVAAGARGDELSGWDQLVAVMAQRDQLYLQNQSLRREVVEAQAEAAQAHEDPEAQWYEDQEYDVHAAQQEAEE